MQECAVIKLQMRAWLSQSNIIRENAAGVQINAGASPISVSKSEPDSSCVHHTKAFSSIYSKTQISMYLFRSCTSFTTSRHPLRHPFSSTQAKLDRVWDGGELSELRIQEQGCIWTYEEMNRWIHIFKDTTVDIVLNSQLHCFSTSRYPSRSARHIIVTTETRVWDGAEK
jgi:hypothetical protein